MKYFGAVLSVADIGAARKFYEDLFGLEVFQDYGKNVAFTCGLALQQDFDWRVGLPRQSIVKNPCKMERRISMAFGQAEGIPKYRVFGGGCGA